MTVSVTTAISGPFVPNSATTEFPFTFDAETTSEVGVLQDGVEISSGFTVALASGAGGTVTFTTAPATGSGDIYIFLKPAFTQNVAFTISGPFLAESHDEANDRAAQRDLYLKHRVDQLLPTDMLDPAVRAGSYLAFDAAGEGTPASGTGNDSALRTDLAATATGGALVGFKRPETSAVPRTLLDKVREQVDLRDWIPTVYHADIAAYGGAADLTTYIQSALDEAPIGCDLNFPPGLLKTTAQLTMTRFVNLIGHQTSVRGNFAATATDLLNINIADSLNTDCRGLRIEGFKALTFDAGGRHVIFIGDGGANVANIGFIIRNNVIETLNGVSAGNAIYLDAVGTHFNWIEHNNIGGGVYLACADGNIIFANLIYGYNTAVTLDLIPGSFRTAIINNGLVSRDGALKVIRGSQWVLRENQIEQFLGYGNNASSHKASVTVVGSAEPNVSHRGEIVNNNFGGGPKVERSIALVGYCEDCQVDGNTFNLCTLNGTNTDVTIYDATVKWTRFGQANKPRGTRAGITVDGNGVASANTSDPQDLLVIGDSGTGTYGLWKDHTTLGLQNSWANSSGFRYRKTLENELVCEGKLAAGTVTAGTVVGTLPDGFRPKADDYLFAVDSASHTTCLFAVSSAGVITVRSVPASATPVFATSRLTVKGRTSYSPGI